MSDTLVADNANYREMFDVSKEAKNLGNKAEPDFEGSMDMLRAKGPVAKGTLAQVLGLEHHHTMFDVERETWTLLSFAACERALRENITFSSHVYKESPAARTFGNSILNMVGDEHKRYRAVVQPMFIKPRAMNWWQPNWINEPVEALMERLEPMERADLNLDLCARLPMHVITRGMGMEGEAAMEFRYHLTRATGIGGGTPEDIRASHETVDRMLRTLIAQRRDAAGDDVVTGLVQRDFALEDGTSRKLTDEEIISYCKLILLAGGGTTWRQLGITIHALLTYGFWEALLADRSLVEPAIEESARWNPNDPMFPRLVTADVELEGVMIPAGSRVDMCLAVANRDPTRWERPDEYDIFRERKQHVGFGLGPHMCLGMNVSKQEMIVAINGLLDRFPNMRIDPDAPPARLAGGIEARGMSAVPVLLR